MRTRVLGIALVFALSLVLTACDEESTDDFAALQACYDEANEEQQACSDECLDAQSDCTNGCTTQECISACGDDANDCIQECTDDSDSDSATCESLYG